MSRSNANWLRSFLGTGKRVTACLYLRYNRLFCSRYIWDVRDSRRMTSVTSACLCWTLLSVCVVVLASDDEDVITPEVGQTVTLTCRAPAGGTIQAVKWSRGDPGDQYVLLFQDGQSDPDKQHPSFKNRVDLQDRQMKDGDVSVILKDVTIDDDGAYECQVLVGEPRSWETISISYLSVQPPGSGGLRTELIIAISFAVLLAAGVAAYVGFKIYRYCKRRQLHNRAQINFRSVRSTNTRPSPPVNMNTR